VKHNLVKVLSFGAILVLVGCASPTSSATNSNPSTTPQPSTTSLTPLVGTWTYSALSGTTNVSETLTITSSTLAITGTLSGGMVGTLNLVGSLVSTVSSTSTSANVILLLTTVSSTGSFSTTAVQGAYSRFTLSLSGSNLALNADAGTATSVGSAQNSTITSLGTTFSNSTGAPATSVSGVTVSPSTLNLTAGGGTGNLTATIYPSNASNKNMNWSSSNTAVASVFGGLVTPVAVGTATITATTADGGYTATCSVSVVLPVSASSINGNWNKHTGKLDGVQNFSGTMITLVSFDSTTSATNWVSAYNQGMFSNGSTLYTGLQYLGNGTWSTSSDIHVNYNVSTNVATSVVFVSETLTFVLSPDQKSIFVNGSSTASFTR